MTSEALLSELLDAGLQLWAEDDQLCFRGPKSVLTPERRSALKEAKPELIGLLGQHRKHAPVSAGQRRLYFLDRFSPGSPLYHIPCFWSLSGPVDPSLIEKAIQTIVDRHESLRTSFRELGGNVYQVVQLEQKIPLEIIPSESATAFTRRWMQAPLDLTSGPVFRAALLPVSEAESLLALLIHHSVFDGRSTEIFRDEFGQALDALSKGTAVKLPKLISSCSDLAARRPDKDAIAEAQHDLDYWLDRLAGELPETQLPTDFPRPPVRSHHGERFSIPLPKDLAERLIRLGEGEGATLFMTGLAAFAALLERYGANGESVIGTPVSGRPSAESNALIGFFVNTLVLRLDSSGDPTFKSMLERVRQSTLKDFAHQQTPFERLVEELKPTRDPGRSPLFQVMFSVQARIPDLMAGGLTVGILPIRPETAKFDLWLSLAETREGWQITLEFSKDLFSRETAERIAGHYLRILTSVAEAPGKKLSQFEILDDQERSSLIEWSRAEGDYPRDLSIPDIFEQQVARTPHATAILHVDRQLDYQTLNDQADRLARRIIDTGLHRFGIIAILTNRSIESVTAILAVLKAGAAYLPLD
ncbi:condensation domain-containing protein, partial [Haloferula sp.]|uniref:condensation domain-containing protein n=1 Tax=Haloferula sp. TaxID=2497595 RepID=UPI003C7839E4